MALNKVKQLVSKPHELLFFVPLEVISTTNRLGRNQVSWLFRLTDCSPLQLATNCRQLNILQRKIRKKGEKLCQHIFFGVMFGCWTR